MADNGCRLTANLRKGCNYESAGVSDIRLANFSKLTKHKFQVEDGKVSTIEMANEEKFYHFDLKQASVSVTEAMQTGSRGNKYLQVTVTMDIPPSPEADAIAKALDLGTFIFSIEDTNGRVFIFGSKNGLEATERQFDTGKEAGDDAGYTYTFVGTETEIKLELKDRAVIEAVTAGNGDIVVTD